MVVRGTEAVEKFFPVIDQHCNYLIGVSAACLASTSVLHPCSIALLYPSTAPFLLVIALFCWTDTGVCTASEKRQCYWKASFCCCQLEVSICWLWVHATNCNSTEGNTSSVTSLWYYTYCCFCSVVPDYAKINGSTTHAVSTDPITGLSDVTFTYTVTRHWSSLAVVESVCGRLTKELTTGDTVLDSLTTHFTQPINITVSAVCSMHTLMCM